MLNMKRAVFICSLFVATVRGATTLEVVAPLGTSEAAPYSPQTGLIQATDGAFYGTTMSGGSNNFGTVFRVTAGGVLTTLVHFDDIGNGSQPRGTLFQASDGNIYGTTLYGGSNKDGTVFTLRTNNAFATLTSFSLSTGGVWPESSLIEGADGRLYGTTTGGGTGNNSGTVFRLETNGTISTFAYLLAANGQEPRGGLLLGNDGAFYGTAYGGGAAGKGTVFRVTTNGTVTTVCSFHGADGSEPIGELASDAVGNLYGTTTIGGPYTNQTPLGVGYGIVFRVSALGVLSTLASFNYTNGCNPMSGLIRGTDGNFYGCAASGGDLDDGTLFQVTPGGTLTRLYSLNGASGGHPKGKLVQGDDGRFYGTAIGGGPIGSGTVFRLGIPLATTQTVQANGTNILLGWDAVVGQNYTVQYNSNLGTTNWYNLGGQITATNGKIAILDPLNPAIPSRFYRVGCLQ
jgi:uncharacterized repeat protein (TIGR03803 family)